MPLQATSGAASYDAFGGGVPSEPNYIESVFSCFLYTGNGSTQTITNGIDLSTKGGLVWIKQRNADTYGHNLVDTVRGNTKYIYSESTSAQETEVNHVTSFNTSGFTLGSGSAVNLSSATFASWTFRKQPKFFDVVTYTGDGTSAQTVPHNLGSTPGMVIIKVTSEANDWIVWHRGLTSGYYLKLNTTAAQSNTNAIYFFGNGTTTVDPTSTVITLGGSGLVSGNGKTYVAYIFAHDAGGFGLTGTDNVISCGSFTTDGTSRSTVNLGYEPQWLLIKKTDAAQSWFLIDTMRGWVNGGADNTSDDKPLYPNLSNAEGTDYFGYPTATGFQMYTGSPSSNYIYIAIRRGPMKVPTSGTSVFAVASATTTTDSYKSNFPVDTGWFRKVTATASMKTGSRLTGEQQLEMANTNAETTQTEIEWDYMDGWYDEPGSPDSERFSWMFRRAPSFCDVVCYTGNSTAGRTVTHNLTVAPELMIVKRRNDVSDWMVWSSGIPITKQLNFNKDVAAFVDDMFNDTLPTSSQFYLTSSNRVNGSSGTYVAYLFATCAGVSKVGSYTGTGTTQTINCGFTAGSRFVMIKRTDSTGDWYVWDSARGIIAGNDPYLLLNSTAAEVTNTDYVDTAASGFEISSTAPAAINASGGTYIFLAIA